MPIDTVSYQTTALATPPSTTKVAVDDLPGGVGVAQYVKLLDGAENGVTPVLADANGLNVSVKAGGYALPVSLAAETTKVIGTVTLGPSATTFIGTVRNQDGIGNALSSTLNALDVNLKTSAITLPISALSLPLPALAATSTKQPAFGGAGAGAVSSEVVTIQGISGMVPIAISGSVTVGGIADNAPFTDGNTPVSPSGYIFDENITGAIALLENDVGAARMDSKRAQVLVLEDGTTRGQRAAVNSSGALAVSLASETGKVIGVTRTADGVGNLIASHSFALDVSLRSLDGTVVVPVSGNVALTTAPGVNIGNVGLLAGAANIGNVTLLAAPGINIGTVALAAGSVIDTELPPAATLGADALTVAALGNNAPAVLAANLGFNGTNYDRVRVSPAGTALATGVAGILAVQGVTGGAPIPISGTVTAQAAVGFLVSASFTRPPDVIAYAAGDALNNSTTSPSALNFPNIARVNGGTGIIQEVVMVVDESAPTVVGSFVLWIMDTTFAVTADNSPLSLSLAILQTVVAVIPMTLNWVDGGVGRFYSSGPVAIPFACTGASRTLYGTLQTTNAYTPKLSGTFQLRAKGWAD